jgi:bifunctional non-homologous end joining protein LigD
MSLQRYNSKRNFDETAEPQGKKASSAKGLQFVVQRHAASRLHYDFRLEMEGVLKSWAIPKGPSLDPADKRLAMMVEDHPYAYRTFEGSIPEGNYGAGEVEVWDHGTYEHISEPNLKAGEKQLLKDLKAGSLKFILHGRKLKGEFALVHMKTDDSNNAWLLIKHRDDYAIEGYNAEDHTRKDSKVTKAVLRKKTPAKKKVSAAQPAAKAVAKKSSRTSKK